MKSVFIDGEAGTTGLGIRERLKSLPVNLLSIDPAHRKEAGARKALMAQADVVILCLPDDAAREAVALASELGESGPRILDASSAHRVAPDWIYGFPEFLIGQPARIAAARRVSNPGCYATGAVALLRPLIDQGLIPAGHPISINAVSGFSGGGRQMIEAHDRTGGPGFELYGLGFDHKHLPEITLHGGLAQPPIFVPSAGHFLQGMLVSIPLHLDLLPGRPSGTDLRVALATHFAGSAHVAVIEPEHNKRLEAEALNGTDRLELRVYADEDRHHAVLVARLDNLGKGASGAAVQNLRLMLGLDEEMAHG